MTRTQKNILGHLVALVRSVRLNEPTTCEGYVHTFMERGSISGMGRFGTKWWYTEKTHRLLTELSEMIARLDDQIEDSDKEAYAAIISDTLKQHAFNEKLFSPEKVFSNRPETLFDARAVTDVDTFVRRLWARICNNLNCSRGSWIVLYPLWRLETPSFQLVEDDLWLLNASDFETWSRIAAGYNDASHWNPLLGQRDGEIFRREDPPSAWAIGRVRGIEYGARVSAERRLRQFIAVLYAILREEKPNALVRSSARTIGYCIQFPAVSSRLGVRSIRSCIGDLCPRFLNNNFVTDDDIRTLERWFSNLNRSHEEKEQRTRVAAIYTNYAFTANSVMKYILYFITLDALYGQRRNVEDSIIAGISGLQGTPADINDRLSLLFDLRSELVHGGASHLEDWKKRAKYVRKHGFTPEKDMEKIALFSLVGYQLE